MPKQEIGYEHGSATQQGNPAVLNPLKTDESRFFQQRSSDEEQDLGAGLVLRESRVRTGQELLPVTRRHPELRGLQVHPGNAEGSRVAHAPHLARTDTLGRLQPDLQGQSLHEAQQRKGQINIEDQPNNKTPLNS